MKKPMIQILYFLSLTFLLGSHGFTKEVIKEAKTGYFIRDYLGLNIHCYVPEDYLPSKKYPLLIALHHEHTNGEAFLPEFQIMAKEKGWIIVCPDSPALLDNSGVSLERVLKKIRRSFNRLYSLSGDILLLGHSRSAANILGFFANKRHSLLRKFSGIVLSGIEIHTDLENPLSNLKKIKPVAPVYLIAHRGDTEVSYTKVRKSRDFLRKRKFKVFYVEGKDFGKGFPSHQLLDIFRWGVLKEKPDEDHIEKGDLATTVVTNEFDILSFSYSSSPKGLAEEEMAPSSVTVENFASTRFFQHHYIVRYLPKKDLGKPGEGLTQKDTYKNVRIVLQVYDKDKKLITTKEKAMLGLDAGTKQQLKYLRNEYGILSSKTEETIDRENTVFGNKFYQIGFSAATKVQPHYASLIIYKGQDIAAFNLLPSRVSHYDFEDLKHILIPGINPPDGLYPETPSVDHIPDEKEWKPGIFRIVE